MKLIFIAIGIFLFLFSCGNPQETIVEPQQIPDASTRYGSQGYNFPELTLAAKDQTVNWGVYEDFITEAKNLNGSTYLGLQDKTDKLVFFIDSLSKIVPDTLQTNPILSRIKVAKTRAYILQQEVKKSYIDSAKIQNDISEMNIAVTNIIVRLNEKFRKDNIDFQQKDEEANELKKQKRFLDSVYQEELKDNGG